MVGKVVIAGINARNVARSARMAGFEVHAVAKYCDADLKLFSRAHCFSEVEEGLERLVSLCQELNAPAVLSTGFEYFSDVRKKIDVIGDFNPACLDKLKFAKELEKAGIGVPKTGKRGWEGTIAKPRFGGGGVGVEIVGIVSVGGVEITPSNYVPGSGQALESRWLERGSEWLGGSDVRWLGSDVRSGEGAVKSEEREEREKEYIYQEFIRGKLLSAIVLSNGENAITVSVNELFSGWDQMNAGGFLYSGNLTPFRSEEVAKVAEVVEEVALLFDVSGCCGVDAVVSDDVYVLELNPRIPGSLDSFELSSGKNLFSMHVKAFEGKLPLLPKFRRYAMRAIYYAPRNLRAFVPATSPFFADVPERGEWIEKQSPVASLLSTGSSREEVIRKVLERKRVLEGFLEFC